MVPIVRYGAPGLLPHGRAPVDCDNLVSLSGGCERLIMLARPLLATPVPWFDKSRPPLLFPVLERPCMPGLLPNRTIVPIDFSDLSFAALDRALEISDPAGTVEVVHVLPEMAANDPATLYGAATDQTRMKTVEGLLREKLEERKLGHVPVHVLLGDAGNEIADFAKQYEADLIVIPSHGYGFFKRVLLGSVAERVIRLAHCPVLVLRS